jgi:hypothetical protein
MKYYPTAMLAIIALFGTLGCSFRPSVADGQNAIADKIKKESQGRIDLVDFKMTDGQGRELSGVKIYRLEYDVTIEFTADCVWLHLDDMRGLSFRTDIVTPASRGEVVRRLDRRKISGSMNFERTEKGWRVSDVLPSPTNIVQITSRVETAVDEFMHKQSMQFLAQSEAAKVRVAELKKEIERLNGESGQAASPPDADLESARASNIVVRERLSIDDVGSSTMVFSKDYKSLIYFTSENIRSTDKVQPYLIVRSVSDLRLIKKIPVPIGYWGGDIARAPDGDKIVWGPFPDRKGMGLLFVDIASEKVTPISLEGKSSGTRLFWPDVNGIFVRGIFSDPCFHIDLDTLNVREVPSGTLDSMMAAKDADDRKTSSKEFILETFSQRKLDDSWNITVADGKENYARELFSSRERGNTTQVMWTPDSRNVFVRITPPFAYKMASFTVLRLGLRSTPALDFDVNGSANFSDDKRQQIKRAVAEGKRIWAFVYAPRINPLNNKILGPDEGMLKGVGYITQIEPTLGFKVTLERHPASTSDVLAVFMVDTEWSWDKATFGGLVKRGEGEPSGLSVK